MTLLRMWAVGMLYLAGRVLLLVANWIDPEGKKF